MTPRHALRTAVFLALASAGLAAQALPITIDATADVYRSAGTDNSDGSSAPKGYAITGGSTFTLFLSPANQIITFDGGGHFNDADGIGSASKFFVNGVSGLSGIYGPNAGAIVGVFLGATLGATPTILNYQAGGNASTSDATYAPLLQQVFFIGDGLRADGTGDVQLFTAPTGATMLYLGFADAAGYEGNPGSYGDNSGTFSALLEITGAETPPPNPPTPGVPEPSTVALLGLGAAALGLRRRHRAIG